MQEGKNQPGKIVSHSLSTSRSGSLAVKINVKFDETGEVEPVYLWLTDATAKRTEHTLCLLGFDCEKQSAEALHKNQTLLAGTPVTVECGNETYNGNTQCKIKFINAAEGHLPQSMIDRATAKLRHARSMPDTDKLKVKARPESDPLPTTGGLTEPPPEEDGQDLPF